MLSCHFTKSSFSLHEMVGTISSHVNPETKFQKKLSVSKTADFFKSNYLNPAINSQQLQFFLVAFVELVMRKPKNTWFLYDVEKTIFNEMNKQNFQAPQTLQVEQIELQKVIGYQ